MAMAALYNQEGAKIGEIALEPSIFEVTGNFAVVHQVSVAMAANARPVVAHTKTRGDVRGGGKKPWRQKGTGRARHGSIRSPIWVGGGVVFGPRKTRNFEQHINKQMKRRALLLSLSDKARDNKIVVLESLAFPESKTKIAKAVFDKLPLGKSVVLALDPVDSSISRAVRNMPKKKVTSATNLGLMDVLSYETLLLTRASLDALVKRLKQ